MNALNQSLYDSLLSAVSDGSKGGGLAGRKVQIKNPGMANRVTYTLNPVRARYQLKIDSSGESYSVCCPFCGDTRYRLSINHVWGIYDPQTDGYNRHLAHCFNEECQGKVEGFQQKLTSMLKTYIRRANKRQVTVAPGYEAAPREIRAPGPMTRIDQLAADHHIHRFLSQRRHDPTLLGQEFDLGYCLSSKLTFADQRLIFPVYLDGLKGWQARHVDANASGDVKYLKYCGDCNHIWRDPTPWIDGVCLPAARKVKVCPNCQSIGNITAVPKYFTCPGMKKTQCLFNYEVARQWPFGIIVEGPMDVCRIGTPEGQDRAGPAVCIFGHAMSKQQKLMAKAAWGDGALVLILDPDASNDQNNLHADLVGRFKHVIPISLPDNSDPDDCEHGLIWKLINAAAAEKGLLPLSSRLT